MTRDGDAREELGIPGQAPGPAFPGGPPEGESEEPLREGLDPRQRRVASLFTQLATTARSFLFYDPKNEAIHNFLETLLNGLVGTLGELETLAVEVRPFELFFEGKPVYLDRDRERSLAFKLYRDGVRSLRFEQGFDWAELARLLEILSVRYSGVHQNEDDLVTLLWKASFSHLDMVTIEGFVPEDDAEPGATDLGPTVGAETGAAGGGAFERIEPPPPRLGASAVPVWTAVPEDRKAALLAEVQAGALPIDCLLLLQRIQRQMDDRSDRLTLSDVAHVFQEFRDFLLSEENLVPLIAFVHLLKELADRDSPPWDPGRSEAFRALLASCGDHRAVQRVLHTVPVEKRQLRREMTDLLRLTCPDPLHAVLEALSHEHGLGARAFARQLLEHFGLAKLHLLQEAFEKCQGAVAADLLRVICRLGEDGMAGFAAAQCCHPDPLVRDEALLQVEGLSYSGPEQGRLLFEAFRRSERDWRLRLLELMARSGDVRFADLLSRHVEAQAASIDPDEAAAIGGVLGLLGGAPRLAQWEEWLRPPGRIRKALAAGKARQVAAAWALAQIPGEAAAQVLRTALANASPEQRRWLGRALASQARGGSP